MYHTYHSRLFQIFAQSMRVIATAEGERTWLLRTILESNLRREELMHKSDILHLQVKDQVYHEVKITSFMGEHANITVLWTSHTIFLET